MSATETRSYIGDSFDVTFWNGTDYVTTQAQYDSAITPNFYEYSESPVGFLGDSTVWLRYYVTAQNVNVNPQYVTVRLNPTYSIFDTEYIYSCLALSFQSTVSSATYDSPASNWYIGGSIQNFHNISESATNSGVQSYLYTTNSSYIQKQFTYVPIVHSSNSAFSCYCVDATFNGNTRTSGSWVYAFLVMCPYVSGSATGASGTFTPSSTPNINVDVNVDMDETNGLLEDIKDGISGIGDTILGLFVPDDQFMEDWKDDMQDLLEDHLGGLYEAVASLDDFWDQFSNVQAKQEIFIPECRIPLAGSELVLGNWHVPLKPTGIPQVLYTSLALIVDFLALMAFLKMCRNKLEIFLNPDSEVVESDH